MYHKTVTIDGHQFEVNVFANGEIVVSRLVHSGDDLFAEDFMSIDLVSAKVSRVKIVRALIKEVVAAIYCENRAHYFFSCADARTERLYEKIAKTIHGYRTETADGFFFLYKEEREIS